MKYVKTIDLWDGDTQTRILNGDLKLQRGQWTVCGKGNAKSRYVGIRPNTIWIAHSEGEKGTKESFPRLLNALKGNPKAFKY